MAKGDWGPKSKLVPVVVNVTFDAQRRIAHCGVGYHIVTPSGTRHDSGFTWHSPAGDYAHGPANQIEALQAVMDALLEAAAAHEGVDLGS